MPNFQDGSAQLQMFSDQKLAQSQTIDSFEATPYYPIEKNGTTLNRINATANVVAMDRLRQIAILKSNWSDLTVNASALNSQLMYVQNLLDHFQAGADLLEAETT